MATLASAAWGQTPHGPAALNEANTVKNNIFAYARLAMTTVGDPYKSGPSTGISLTSIPQSFVYTNNIFYFDRSEKSNPKFLADGGCLYTNGAPFTQYQLWKSNVYWPTDGGFSTDAQAFGIQPNAGTGPAAPCSSDRWVYEHTTRDDNGRRARTLTVPA